MKTNELNKIVKKDTVQTSYGETYTVWTNLLALSRFAGTSKPERDNAIQQLKYAIEHYEMREWHQKVLEGIIKILEIAPHAE